MSRKKKHEEHENQERWLVSYADFITLLFCFFVYLYATSQTDAAKLEALRDALSAAFEGGLPTAVLSNMNDGSSNIGLSESHVTLNADTTSLVVSMKQGLRGSLSDNVVQIGNVNQTLMVALPERIAFAGGSADLHPSAYDALEKVAKVIATQKASIEVIGSADGVPLSPGSPYTDNWDLATSRAASAVRFLQDHGVPGEQLSATGLVTDKVSTQARSIIIRVKSDSPALGRELTNELDAAGLLAVP